MLADENGVSVKVAKYAGKNKVDLIENEEYGYCSLVKATNQVLEKMRIENITKTKVTGAKRIEKNLIETVPMREALINAVVHNDFSHEIPPVFEIFSDRMEFTSYGGLIQGQSKEDFFSCSSMPRNRELMRVFKDVGLVEQLGSGMSRILQFYDKSIFEISDYFIAEIGENETVFVEVAGDGCKRCRPDSGYCFLRGKFLIENQRIWFYLLSGDKSDVQKNIIYKYELIL